MLRSERFLWGEAEGGVGAHENRKEGTVKPFLKFSKKHLYPLTQRYSYSNSSHLHFLVGM